MKKMNKKLVTLWIGLLLSIMSVFLAFAADGLPRLVDMADLLSDSEEAALSEELDEISERQKVDVVVVTVSSLEGESAMAYADDFYDYNEYGFGEEKDGILFLISMEEREWHITTTGYGIRAVTDSGIESISSMMIDDLQEGDYGAAFTTYAQMCDEFITEAREWDLYDDGSMDGVFGLVGSFVMSFGLAFVIALIVTGIMKGQLKTVRGRSAADDYIKEGSMELTKENDLFLYRQIDRREKPKNDDSNQSEGSSTHTSSSGTTHGGGGGKF